MNLTWYPGGIIVKASDYSNTLKACSNILDIYKTIPNVCSLHIIWSNYNHPKVFIANFVKVYYFLIWKCLFSFLLCIEVYYISFLKVLVLKILAKFWSMGLQLITLGTRKPFESNFSGLLKHERETMNWAWCDNINIAHQTNALSLIIDFQKSLFAWAPVFVALLQCFLL